MRRFNSLRNYLKMRLRCGSAKWRAKCTTPIECVFRAMKNSTSDKNGRDRAEQILNQDWELFEKNGRVHWDSYSRTRTISLMNLIV